MKPAALVSFFVAITTTMFADAQSVSRPARSSLRDELTAEFQYAPNVDPSSVPDLTTPGDQKFVRLELLIVTSPQENRLLESIFQLQEKAFNEKIFSFQNGGIVFEHRGQRITTAVK